MRNTLFSKRIPTLLGLILLGIGLVAVNYAVTHQVFFLTQASPTYAPEEIRITNLTDTSFTVSYVTNDRVLGTLNYSSSNQDEQIALDDRDQQSGNPQPYYIHHITLKNLKPNTAYSFSITSDDKKFLDDNKLFAVTTLSRLTETPTTQPPIVGKVSNPGGSTDNNIIVFLVTENAQTLSSLTRQDGTFVMPLNALRTSDYSRYITFSQTSVIKLLAVGKDGKSTISVLPSQINPVPPVTLNNSYDFTTSIDITPVPIASSAADTSAFPSFEATEASEAKPTILNPTNQETFSDQQPQFEGTAVPNASIEIEIHSGEPIKATINANSNGSWNFRPPAQLEPGDHTITIKSRDNNGILQTITRSFTVFAEGSQFTEPSVSPTIVTPTPIINRITPTGSPSAVPTPTLTATPTASPTPTTPPPSIILTQSVPPPTESPGSSFVLLSGIIGVIAVGAGFFLLFLGKGSTL